MRFYARIACGNPHFHTSWYKISYDTRGKNVFLHSYRNVLFIRSIAGWKFKTSRFVRVDITTLGTCVHPPISFRHRVSALTRAPPNDALDLLGVVQGRLFGIPSAVRLCACSLLLRLRGLREWRATHTPRGERDSSTHALSTQRRLCPWCLRQAPVLLLHSMGHDRFEQGLRTGIISTGSSWAWHTHVPYALVTLERGEKKQWKE